MKTLVNLIHPENVGNELNLSIDQQEISLDELKDRLKFIPSQPYLFDYLTGNENIEYLMSLFDFEDEYETIKKNLMGYNLQDSLNDKVLTYSLGMKTKLFLAVMLEKPSR